MFLFVQIIWIDPLQYFQNGELIVSIRRVYSISTYRQSLKSVYHQGTHCYPVRYCIVLVFFSTSKRNVRKTFVCRSGDHMNVLCSLKLGRLSAEKFYSK